MREKTRKGIVEFIDANYKNVIKPKFLLERVFYIQYFKESIYDRFGCNEEIDQLINETIKLQNKNKTF